MDDARKFLADLLAEEGAILTEAQAERLWNLTKAFQKNGDRKSADALVTYILNRETGDDFIAGDDLDKMRERSIATLYLIGRRDEAVAFADRLEKRAFELADGKDLEPSVVRLGKASVVALRLGRKHRTSKMLEKAAALLNDESSATPKQDDVAMFDSLMRLAAIASWPDHNLAKEFLEIAMKSAGRDPRFEARSVKCAVLAARWASLDDFRRAREAAESAVAPLTENLPIEDEEYNKYYSSEIDTGGMVGGYLAILDAWIAKAFKERSLEFGANLQARKKMPWLVSLKG